MTQSIRNIAIIAHVDHGKTTLVDKIIQECEILNTRKDTGELILDNNDLERENGNKLLNILFNDSYQVNGKTTFKEEFVTCGGISLHQISPNTMESKTHKGLYFCGEILDIDGVTGGFNFQSTWTTGYLAGKNSVI